MPKNKKGGSPAGDALGVPALLHGCRCRGRPPQGTRSSSCAPATGDALAAGDALPSRAPAAGDALLSRAPAAGDTPTLLCGGRRQGARPLMCPPLGRPVERRGRDNVRR
ncbi:unnamed protein product [Urochloa humidicola]